MVKRNYKKTLWASIIVFVLGTSCCWVSTLVIWVGGAAVIGVISKYLPNIQVFLIALGVTLGLITLYLYQKK